MKDISGRDCRQERQKKSDWERGREMQLLLKMIGEVQVPLCISVNFEEFLWAHGCLSGFMLMQLKSEARSLFHVHVIPLK